MNEVLITICCEAPPEGDIDYDSEDGSYGEAITTAHSYCSDCQEWSKLQVE